MDTANIIPVVHSDKRVLTTAQLADFYGCDPRNISENFKNNESRFKEGVHYFKLVGEPLKKFKSLSDEIGLPINKFSPVLYLWTERGAARHAKLLSTDMAWEVYEELEDNYFNPPIAAPAVAKPAKTKNPNRVAGQKTPAGIYAAKVGDKVKIGHSHDAEKRLPHIKGRTDKTYYQTALFPRKIARLLEWACHTIFAPFALGNELFDIEYDEACRIIMTLEKLIVRLSKVYSYECDDKSLVVATKNFVEYVNLIADKSN